jgi:hypothetical protein
MSKSKIELKGNFKERIDGGEWLLALGFKLYAFLMGTSC